jgi:hypothetical protein
MPKRVVGAEAPLPFDSPIVAIPPLLLPFAIGGIEPYTPFFMAAIAYVPCAALRIISIELLAVFWACPIRHVAAVPKGLLWSFVKVWIFVYYARRQEH